MERKETRENLLRGILCEMRRVHYDPMEFRFGFPDALGSRTKCFSRPDGK